MSGVKFEVYTELYKRLLSQGAATGINAVAEQALSDSNRYVKIDQGTLRDSGRVEGEGIEKAISWNTPYALRQYYTGTPIDHGKNEGEPSLQWAHKAQRLHGKNWLRIMTKEFGEGLK